MSYIGRLAPSPTGYLHLGHARTFWVAAERARQAGGTLLFRDDDLDSGRVRPHFAEAMREDLRWLGLRWDAEFRQSERLPLYEEAMRALLRAGAVYPCACSRKELAASVAAPHEETDDEPVYAGRCRGNACAADAALTGASFRFRVDDGATVSFVDGAAGTQEFVAGCDAAAADFGDFVVWRRDGTPSYQLACAVDDALMGVTEVVRGRDLLKSTARQILLQRALRYATPAYFHAELMRDEAGVRLAKRHDALSLRALREAGWTAQRVLASFGAESAAA